jgi:hypothetical protein
MGNRRDLFFFGLKRARCLFQNLLFSSLFSSMWTEVVRKWGSRFYINTLIQHAHRAGFHFRHVCGSLGHQPYDWRNDPKLNKGNFTRTESLLTKKCREMDCRYSGVIILSGIHWLTATGWTVRGWNAGGGHRSRPALVPPILLYSGYRVLPGGKAAEAWRWPPTPSSSEVKERVELYLYPLYGFSWPVLGWTLPLSIGWRVLWAPCIRLRDPIGRPHHSRGGVAPGSDTW